MSYLVFARKWRPQNFDEVIGQEHIATTLKNAISLNRVAHAYLFSGPRGTGKTSMARILAKALNCEKGPAPSPCGRCDSCKEISDGRSLDVIEIDGASNRGIEQIRQLRENVKFAPAKARFKIYIIDEVHQITTDGFNALLKTLEEPPAHVKFIFATTQAYKVLPTIISRCQRFDFKALAVSAVAEKLKRIIKKEKLDVSEEALLYIARAAAGSMRDAESILDQLTSFCRGQVKLETVTRVLGMIGLEALGEVAQKIIEKKTPQALMLVERIINEGKDLFQFTAGLMEHFRNIMVAKTIGEKSAGQLIDLPQEHLKRLIQQSELLSLEEIFYIFNILTRAQESLRRTLSARVIVEMAVVKLTQRENLSSLRDILNRLAKIEQALEKPVLENNSEENNSEEILAQGPVSVSSAELGEELSRNWGAFLQAIRAQKMLVASALELGKAIDLKGNTLSVAFPKNQRFYKETLEQNKKFIETKGKEIFKRDLKLRVTLDKDLQAASDETKPGSLGPGKKTAAEPIIQSALKIFQGRIIRRTQ